MKHTVKQSPTSHLVSIHLCHSSIVLPDSLLDMSFMLQPGHSVPIPRGSHLNTSCVQFAVEVGRAGRADLPDCARVVQHQPLRAPAIPARPATRDPLQQLHPLAFPRPAASLRATLARDPLPTPGGRIPGAAELTDITATTPTTSATSHLMLDFPISIRLRMADPCKGAQPRGS